jgi:hypothetical protein
MIVTVHDRRVILSPDLARIYGVQALALNQAVRRNACRFPTDFAFRLTSREMGTMRSQIVTASKRNIRYPSCAFTEHGAIMAATVLNSPRAVQMSVYVVRAFVRMRREMLARSDMEKRLILVEKTLLEHDSGLRDLYQKIRPLLLPPPDPPRRKIGFGNG